MAKAIASLVGLLVIAEVLLRSASWTRAPIDFDVGPSTGAYLKGFTESEERPPASFRWTGAAAAIEIPLSAPQADPGTLVIRYARFLPQNARVHVYASGRPVASFSARSGRFRTERFPLTFPEGPIRLDISAVDPDPTGLGVAPDWMRLEGPRWTLPLSVVGPRLAVAGVFLLCLFTGFSTRAAFIAALSLGLAQAIGFALDPFGMTHVAGKIVAPCLVLTAAVAAFVRRRRAGRWIMLVFLTGYVLKGAGIFHPSYFYPDVRNHRRYVFSLADAEGTLPERGLEAQIKVRTAYPRHVGGRAYAFPYSPLFFVPFTWLPRDPHLVEDALKHVSLAAAAAEVVVVYWLAAVALGETTGVTAALVAAFLPPMYSRLLLAMYPTVAGHLLDALAIAAGAMLASRPESLRRLAGFAVLTLASFLTYISSLFNLTAIFCFLSVFERRLTRRLLAVGTGAVLVTILSLYLSFTLTFVREILPALWASPGPAKEGSLLSGFGAAFYRVILFYGYGFPALTLAGLAVVKRRSEPGVFRCLLAYGASFVLLVTLRAVSAGLFRDLKEILFVGPLVAVGTGASLTGLAGRGRSGKLAAVLVAAALLAFSMSLYREYLGRHVSLAGLGALD